MKIAIYRKNPLFAIADFLFFNRRYFKTVVVFFKFNTVLVKKTFLSQQNTHRWTIGKTADWTIEDARKEARRLQTLLDRGIDPREQEQAQKAEKAAKKAAVEANAKYTFSTLLNAYTDY
ncbi:MAG: integrase arm-type DNA-binding domain-containing protein, partial [Candidatus Moraniibacteriota bacterium]